MKILFWVEYFWPEIGGVETFGSQLIDNLRSRGYSFTVVANGPSDTPDTLEIIDGLPIWRFPMRNAIEQRNMGQIVSILTQLGELQKSVKPDLIHLNTTGPGSFFYLRVMQSLRVPTLLTLHMPLMSTDMGSSLTTKTLESADYLVGVSKYALSSAVRLAPDIRNRSSAILNALAQPAIEPSPLPFAPPVLLCVGRMTKQKGFDIAIEAMSTIIRRYPQVKLVMAGAGDASAALEAQIERLGLHEHIGFVGKVPHQEIYNLLNQTTILLVPSRYEPFGLVALEAAQMARPVIASAVDGLPEIVVDRETGLLTPPEDSAQLAEAVLHLLDHPDLCTQYGEAARQRAEAKFSFARFLDSYEGLYRQLCSSV
jgi:glycogen(starch) synthase